jgi:hypothetical protein
LLSENALGLFGVVPELRLGSELVELLDPLLFPIDVKDASAKVRGAPPAGKVALWSLLTSL